MIAIWLDLLADLAKGLEAPQSVPGSKLEQHWISLPKVAVQIAEGGEIGEVAGQLYQALSDGLLVAEAEIHRVYNEPFRGGEVFKFHVEWPRVGQLSRDWWIYGRARIDPPGTRTFEPKDPSVASVFSQLLEVLAKEGTECWELTLTKPYGNRAGGHPNDLDLATKIRCLRSDVERIFVEAKDKPPRRGRPPTPPPDRRFSEAALRKWYKKKYVKRFDKDSKPPTREEDLAAARHEVSKGVPREAVRKLRAKYAPAEWRKQGRRKTGGK